MTGGRATYDFSGQGVLVIGGTTGIGRAAAAAFAGAGARVVFAGLGSDDGRTLERKIVAAGGDALFVEVDVRREAEMQVLFDTAVARLGRVDIALNNAGVEGPFGATQDLSSDDFDRIIGVNLKGMWLGMKLQIPHMLANGAGVIVNTASTAGVKSIPMVPVYSASKHAIVGLTRAAALENAAAGLRINAIAPGPVDTGLLHRMVAGHIDVSAIAAGTPLGRISSPEEIARAMLWLSSEDAAYVTGHVLLVDGGLTVA
jgi:NAD(P)-dependent dehydrogenase (short-subunit alcohol dehydrogenase family)